ncbi:MAG: DUF4097 domain-containing protein [Rhodothermales bacterium]
MRKLSSLFLILFLAAPVLAQNKVITDDDWCDDKGWNNDLENYCEVREYELKADRNRISIDGGQNGGITVKGWDRNEILVRAKVSGHARTKVGAKELAEEVEVLTRRTIEADVPNKLSNWGRRAWVSVSFEVFVPHESNLSLDTHNGGVTVKNVAGDVSFEVLNGGVSLYNLAGDVEGHTTNGGLSIILAGDEWEGEGLDVKTTNGGVKLEIPDGYSAQLETGTVNGRLNFDFPVMVKGRLDRQISTKLGDGGKTIRVMTTNGAVKVGRS